MNQAKIGKFLAELRKENGMTQEQLAEKLNVARRTISRWETGNNMPDIVRFCRDWQQSNKANTKRIGGGDAIAGTNHERAY